MNEEQLIGVLALAAGSYFVICSTWKRNFFLYKLKVRRMANTFGEGFAHGFYKFLGVAIIIGGVLKIFRVF